MTATLGGVKVKNFITNIVVMTAPVPNSRYLKARVIYLLQDAPSPDFEEIFALKDPRAAAEAMFMSNLFTKAVRGDLKFDFNYAEQLVREQPDMALFNRINHNFIRHDFAVSALVAEISNYLSNQIGVAIDSRLQQQISLAISDVFVNLNIQKEDAWIFWAKESGFQTTYRYNILFAIQNELTNEYVYGLPIAFTVTIQREYERVLFITIKDELTLSVYLEGLKVGKLLNSYTTNNLLQSINFAY